MKTAVTIDRTLTIAIYAACVSTAAVLWDAYKWKTSGPKIAATLAINMKVIGGPSRYGDKTLMSMTVTNRGDRPTTITHLAMHRYASWWSMMRRRASDNWIVTDPSESQRLPFELKPGAVWIGMAEQTPDVEGMARAGLLYVAVLHSHSERSIQQRVRFAKEQGTEKTTS
jgi:hypothetical protein